VLRVICRNLDPQVYDLRIVIGKTEHFSGKTRSFLDEFADRLVIIPELKRDVCLWDDWTAFCKLWGVFRRGKFDIVHTHTAKAGALGRLAALIAGVPVIIHTPHGHNFYGYFNKAVSRMVIIIERFLALFTDRMIALTELEKNDYSRFKVASGGKVVLIYMGLEPDILKPGNSGELRNKLEIESSGKLIGYVGRLDPVKGPQFFIEAARICLASNPGLKFVLCGEGSLRRQLEDRVDLLGLKGRIIFLGWREDAPDIISCLDMLILPSLNEAVGIVLIEAQSLGVPVIASNVGGVPETLRDGQTGILVPPGDPRAIAEAAAGLLADPQKMRNMSAAAREWAGRKFKAGDMVEHICAVYRQVIEEKNADN